MIFNSAWMDVFSPKTLKEVVSGLLIDGCMNNKVPQGEKDRPGLPQEGAEKKKMENEAGRRGTVSFGQRCT